MDGAYGGRDGPSRVAMASEDDRLLVRLPFSNLPPSTTSRKPKATQSFQRPGRMYNDANFFPFDFWHLFALLSL
jgi:hypothetical protein